MQLFQREKDLLDGFHKMVINYYSDHRTLLSCKSYTDTTKAIKDYFRIEGNKQGFHVSPDEQSKTPEWLFDTVWFQQKEGKYTGVMTEVELILESELNASMNEIRYDFEKLLTTSPNIPFKIFICLKGNKQLEDVKSYFDDAVQSCRTVVSGDSFICLIGDDYDTGLFTAYKVIKK